MQYKQNSVQAHGVCAAELKQLDKMSHSQGCLHQAEPGGRESRIGIRNVAEASSVAREEPRRLGQVGGGGFVAGASFASYRQADGQIGRVSS